jgi:hypothetical protein
MEARGGGVDEGVEVGVRDVDLAMDGDRAARRVGGRRRLEQGGERQGLLLHLRCGFLVAVWRRPCHKRIVCGDWRFFRWLVVIYTGRHHGFSVGWRWGLSLVTGTQIKIRFGSC